LVKRCGIEKAAAVYFAGRGWAVAATMRQPEAGGDLANLPNVTLHKLDVTDEATVSAARDNVLEHQRFRRRGTQQCGVCVDGCGCPIFGRGC
jgi:NAD(P)-dependent dehydrogenase (short-subunit alcohol dehydrogenase family)